jgi:hypothetical protein
MKYAAEMALGGMVCIPSFMTISYGIQVTLRLLPQFQGLNSWYYILNKLHGIQKLLGERGDTHTHRWQGNLISLILFLKIKQVG